MGRHKRSYRDRIFMGNSITHAGRPGLENRCNTNFIQMKTIKTYIKALYRKNKTVLQFAGQIMLAFGFLGVSLALILTLTKHFQ